MFRRVLGLGFYGKDGRLMVVLMMIPPPDRVRGRDDGPVGGKAVPPSLD